MTRHYYPAPYPDPDMTPRPSTLPPPFPPQLTSITKPPEGRPYAKSYYPLHNHQAFVDGKGNGTTDVAASHYHRVKDGRVLPDASDGHYHELTGLPSGAGAIFRNFG